MTEQWLPIKGYEGLYEISNHGQVKSLARQIKGGWHGDSLRNLKERVLRLGSSDGYPQAMLSREGKKKNCFVHRLVIEAFVGPAPGPVGLVKGMWTVDHINAIRTDNSSHNLRWLTVSENASRNN